METEWSLRIFRERIRLRERQFDWQTSPNTKGGIPDLAFWEDG
ncbi:hypothetical protein [Larkinella ripae]